MIGVNCMNAVFLQWMRLEKKIAIAEAILKEERESLLWMLSDGSDDFASPKDFMPFYEEDAKYRIRDLHLPESYESHYLNKICDIYGPYSEDKPSKQDKYYDNDFYRHRNETDE